MTHIEQTIADLEFEQSKIQSAIATLRRYVADLDKQGNLSSIDLSLDDPSAVDSGLPQRRDKVARTPSSVSPRRSAPKSHKALVPSGRVHGRRVIVDDMPAMEFDAALEAIGCARNTLKAALSPSGPGHAAGRKVRWEISPVPTTVVRKPASTARTPHGSLVQIEGHPHPVSMDEAARLLNTTRLRLSVALAPSGVRADGKHHCGGKIISRVEAPSSDRRKNEETRHGDTGTRGREFSLPLSPSPHLPLVFTTNRPRRRIGRPNDRRRSVLTPGVK